MICNLGVVGSNPSGGSTSRIREEVSRKAHNLEVTGSNPVSATKMGRHTIRVGTMCLEKRTPSLCGSSSVDRAEAFQASGRGFEPRLPLKKIVVPQGNKVKGTLTVG